jgi:hypothetical protein
LASGFFLALFRVQPCGSTASVPHSFFWLNNVLPHTIWLSIPSLGRFYEPDGYCELCCYGYHVRAFV